MRGVLERTRAVLLAALCVLGVSATAADARGPLDTIVQDDAQLLHGDDAAVGATLDRLRDLGVDTVRLTAGWSVLTREPEAQAAPSTFDQTDPAAYEQGRFTALDRAVRLASARGLRVLMDIGFWAPHWATADEPAAPRARTRVDAAAYGRFATALARRYSGAFTPPATIEPVPPSEDGNLLEDLFGTNDPPPPATAPSAGPLPRVGLFSLWNEPNHPAFLLPQRARGADASPTVYRAMVRAGVAAIHGVQGDAQVLIGGLASKATNGRGLSPLRFIRELACVDGRLRPLKTAECRNFTPLPGEGYTAHPYSLSTPPDARPSKNQPDDLPLGALPRLTTLLRKLAAAKRIGPGLKNVWITEYGYETNPPATTTRYGLEDQARFLPWAEYLAWREPQVRAFAQFLLKDLAPAASQQGESDRRAFGQWESGLLFADGTAKPAADGFAGGLFVRPLAGRTKRLAIWGRVRTGSGARGVTLEMRKPGSSTWQPLPSTTRAGGARAAAFTTGGIFERVIPAARVRPGSRFRMRYRVGEAERTSPAVAALNRPSPLP
jgi:hypothetical protein